jgi:NAD(P)-dependent dehydrogenase (short-subunit alcohol dehydrogenase family)
MSERVLITGGAGGLGLALARAFHAAGHTVLLLDLLPDALALAAAELGFPVETIAADVTSRPRVAAGLARLAAPPTVLVNGAGVAASVPLLPPDDDLWDRTMAVNATGTWIVTTACLPAFRAAGKGAIVNVVSTAGLRAYRYAAAYVASKHAMMGLTRALVEDLRGTGVHVAAVCPGFLDTPMTDRTVATIVRKTGMTEEAARKTIGEMNASQRLITPEEVAESVVELAADPARHGDVIRIE